MAQFKNTKSVKPKIVIRSTSGTLLGTQSKKAPILRAYYRPFVFVAVPLNILTDVLAVIFYRFLPPVIPLWGTMLRAADRLAGREWIFLLPAIATGITLIHTGVIYFARHYDEVVLQMFELFTIFVQILILAVLLRTVLVVI